MSSGHNLGFARLKGRENFTEWKTGAKAYLISKGHWNYVITELAQTASPDEIGKDAKACAEIILLIEPNLYSYIENAETAKKAWDSLIEIFEDKGTMCKVSLFKQWISLQLSECSSMHEYVNKSVSLRAKVRTAGFEIGEDIAGSILLCGLSDEYKPLIMSMEAKDKLTLDYVKNLLLQSIGCEEASENALSAQNRKKFNKKFNNNVKKPDKCYDCDGPHYRSKCPNREKGKWEKSDFVLFTSFGDRENHSKPILNDNSVSEICNSASSMALYSALATDVKNDDWYVDSGATRHMSHLNLELENVKKSPVKEVTVANNEKLKINHVGDLKCHIGEQLSNVTLKNVHYIPNLCVNLLSVSEMVKNGSTVVFDIDGVIIYGKNKKDMIANGKLSHRLVVSVPGL